MDGGIHARRRSDVGGQAAVDDARTIEGIAHLGALLTSELEVEAATSQVVQYSTIITGLPCVLMLLASDGNGLLKVAARDGGQESLDSVVLEKDEVRRLGLDRLGAVRLDTIAGSTESPFRALGDSGYKTVWTAPIRTAEEGLKGVILGLDRRQEGPDEQAVRAFQLLALEGTTAVWNAERYQAELNARLEKEIMLEREQVRSFRAHTVNDMLSEITRHLEPATVAGAFVKAVRERVVDGFAEVSRFDASDGTLRCLASSGMAEEVSGTLAVRPDSADPRVTAVSAKAASFVASPSAAALNSAFRSLVRSGTASYAVLPLNVGDKVVGVCSLGWRTKRSFDDDERQFLTTLASGLALALRNAELYAKVQRDAALSTALAEIDSLLHGTMDPHEIVQRGISLGADVLGADTAAVSMYQAGEFIVTYVHNWPPDSVGTRIPQERERHSLFAMRSGDVVAVSDTEQDPRVDRELMREWGIKSVIAAPLVVKDQGIGVAYFNYTSLVHSFTSEEMAFTSRLASSLSLALENARLYQEERRIAETLQSALLMLPDQIEGLRFSHVYRSATEAARVGGDFYDLFELENGRLGLLIGDVSGKGVNAASLTMVTRNAVRAYALTREDPAEVIELVNTMVLGMSDADTFATAFFGVLDRDTGRLDYCIAGHPPALVKRRGGEVEYLSETSPFLGAFEEMSYESGHDELSPGDVLLLYTDGVLEARGTDGEFFGEERLSRVLGSAQGPDTACDELFEELIEFTGGQLTDDVVVFALALEER